MSYRDLVVEVREAIAEGQPTRAIRVRNQYRTLTHDEQTRFKLFLDDLVRDYIMRLDAKRAREALLLRDKLR